VLGGDAGGEGVKRTRDNGPEREEATREEEATCETATCEEEAISVRRSSLQD
jgi:hypothetical protein